MALDPDGDLTTLLRAIVDVESVSGNERELADLVEAALRARPHLDVVRDGDAVVARTNLGRPHRVVIAGHLDTVPVAGNLPSSLVEGERGPSVVGRGTCDMKGGVAVQLKLATELAEPVHDVTWIFYDHEEVGAEENGLGRLVANAPWLVAGDLAVLMEPTSAVVEGGCQGTCRVAITVEGRAAHSARSWLGVNAIHGLADVLNRLVAHRAPEVVVDGLTYREGLNAVRVSGGVAGNIVPPSARIEINYRFAPDKSPDDALAELHRVLPGYDLEVTDMAGGARPGLDHPLVRDFLSGADVQVRAKYGWTDVARFSGLGIPALNFGPGDPEVAHTDGESCPVWQLEACAATLRRWLTGTEDK